MLKVINSISTLSFLASICLAVIPVQVHAQSTNLQISEVKVRYDASTGTDYDEYIELYNDTEDEISLAGYALEYFNATNPLPAQQPVQKSIDIRSLPTGGSVVLAKQPSQIEHSLQSPFSSLSDTGGRLRLVTVEGDIVDEIAWTNTQSIARTDTNPPVLFQCNTSTLLCNSNRLLSFSRVTVQDIETMTMDTAWELTDPSPISDRLITPDAVPTDEPDDHNEQTDVESTPDPVTTCEGITISELLPNPSGSDTGREFIELHNPTNAPILLEGCSMQISGSTKTYMFGAVELGPDAFLAFNNSVTGLTLPNAAGGTVYLLSPNEEIYSVVYPGDMDDDAAWSNVNGVFGTTYILTPSAANISQPLKPCPSGQSRDAISGQCRVPVMVAVAALTACKPGQERNPETNRCRTVVTTASASGLVACKPGQERNPDTNRCRAVLAASTLTPCSEGQERNPETNRCRKVTGEDSAKLAAVTDIASPASAAGPAWWLIGGAILLAAGYAVLEWRQDIWLWFSRQSARFSR